MPARRKPCCSCSCSSLASACLQLLACTRTMQCNAAECHVSFKPLHMLPCSILAISGVCRASQRVQCSTVNALLACSNTVGCPRHATRLALSLPLPSRLPLSRSRSRSLFFPSFRADVRGGPSFPVTCFDGLQPSEPASTSTDSGAGKKGLARHPGPT